MADSAPAPLMESRILLLRGQKILLDADLAALYQVETRHLNEAVSRNRERFPEDFLFQLSREEEGRTALAPGGAGPADSQHFRDDSALH